MTDKIKSALSIIENEKECVQSSVFCDRDCANCKLVKEDSEIIGAFDITIRSLKAWEEVLQELEDKRDSIGGLSKFDAYDMAIDIVNQKLAKIDK